MSDFKPTPCYFINGFPEQIRKVASVTTADSQLNVYWDDETQTVLYQFENNWWYSKDSNILESVAYFCGVPSSLVRFSGLFVFDMPGKGKAADNEVQVGIYECDWSDFACEKLYLEFEVRTDRYFVDNCRRGGAVLAELNCPYEPTLDDEIAFEDVLRLTKILDAQPKKCACVEPNPEKYAFTTCDAVYVGDDCLNCQCSIASSDREREMRIWKKDVEKYQGMPACCPCADAITEDRVGKIRCSLCWKQVRLECACANPAVYRKMNFEDGYYASLTCSACKNYLPSKVLEEFEAEIVAFVEETQGRL